MKLLLSCGLIGLIFATSASGAASTCNPADPTLVCGVSGPEDLVRLAGTPWIVTSELRLAIANPPRNAGFGPLDVINIDTRKVRRFYPTPTSKIDWDRDTYPDCAGPPAAFSSHGLNAQSLGGNRFRVYAVNHGGRESIEIIDVAVHGQRLDTSWRGCIRVPEPGPPNGIWPWPNGVASLPDGGIVVSGYNVAIWRPKLGWAQVDHLKTVFSNGVEVSHDGKWLFVVDSLSKSVIRVPVSGDAAQTVFHFDFLPDNVRWGEDGHLYVAGGRVPEGWSVKDANEFFASPMPPPLGFAVAQIDPDTLTSREVLHSDGSDGSLKGASTALQLGNYLWICGGGDHLAIVPLPPQDKK